MWLSNESNQLFLPMVHPEKKKEMFEEVYWECTFQGTVQARSSPEVSDTSETWVKTGQSISALPVAEHPGWLIEADSKLFYPMNHPKSGDVLFKSKTSPNSSDLEEGQGVLKDPTDDPSCEQVAAAISLCIPLVGCVTFCVSAANNKEGSNKRKWGNIACGVATASAILGVMLRFTVFSTSSYYQY